jgi:NADH:ubiquinone oxidoreductase subunit 6 (subunit J)
LIGAVPQPISSAPLVILIYVVLILMVGCALASVVLRNLLYAVGAFAATMLLVAILYLTIAPVLLFAFQLLVFTTVSSALLIGLLRQTSGLTASRVGPLSREWIIGAGVAGAFFALLGVVLAVTSWPVRACCALPESFTYALGTTYVVGVWTLAILLGSAALGSGLLLASTTVVTRAKTPSPTLPTRGRELGGRGRRR